MSGSSPKPDPIGTGSAAQSAEAWVKKSPDDDRVLVVGGEIDLATAVLLRDALLRYVPDPPGWEGGAVLVLDMAQVTFFGAAGVGAIAEAQRAGVRVRIAGAPPRVARVLHILGMQPLMSQGAPTEAAARMPEDDSATEGGDRGRG